METQENKIEFTKKEDTMDAALNTLRKTLELYAQSDKYDVIDYSINKIFDNEGTFYKVKVILSDNSKKKGTSRVMSA